MTSFDIFVHKSTRLKLMMLTGKYSVNAGCSDYFGENIWSSISSLTPGASGHKACEQSNCMLAEVMQQ